MMKHPTTYRSSLKPAQAFDAVFIVDAAYGSGKIPRPICSLCWSQLDYAWGKGHSGAYLKELEGRKDEPWVDKDGEEWYVWAEPYRCCNPKCNASCLVRMIPAKLTFESPYHPDDVKRLTVKKKKYKEGRYRKDGVFEYQDRKGTWTTKEEKMVDVFEVSARIDDPWVYINPGKLKDDIPKQWTVVDDEIKSNMSSNRYKKIKQWFNDRGIKLDTLLNKGE